MQELPLKEMYLLESISYKQLFCTDDATFISVSNKLSFRISVSKPKLKSLSHSSETSSSLVSKLKIKKEPDKLNYIKIEIRKTLFDASIILI